MNRQLRGEMDVIASAVFFGLMPLFARIAAAGGSTALSTAFYRFFFAALMFVSCLLFKHTSFAITRRECLKILPLSVFYTLTPILLYLSYDFISSGLATTLHFTYPVAVILLLFLVYRQRMSRLQLICTALCVGGIALLSPGEFSKNGPGAALALASGVTYALYVVLLEKSGLERLPLLTLSFWLTFFSAVFIGLTAALSGRLVWVMTSPAWGALVLLALLSTVFALVLFQRGLFDCGPVKATLLSTFEPLTGIGVGIVLFGERLTLCSAVGAALVMASAVLLVRGSD